MKVIAFNGSPQAPGDIQNDAEGIKTFQILGQNMAKLLSKSTFDQMTDQ